MRRRWISLTACLALWIWLLIVGSLSYAQPDDLAFSRNARTFETQNSSLIQKGLALSCLTMLESPDSLPCNPAFTPLEKKGGLQIEVQLSNGYNNLEKVRTLLSGSPNADFLNSLFANSNVLQIEAAGTLEFKSKYFNGSYTPMSVKGFAAIRNEADPDVDIYAVQAQGFEFQSGYQAAPHVYTGVQVRFENRKYIRKRFKLAELGTADGQKLLQPQTQNATYIEPSVSYIMPGRWHPRATFMMANLGFVTPQTSDLPTPVEPQVGIGISPPLRWGMLELSLEYRSMNYEEKALEKFRAGLLYKFGSMFLTGGIDANGLSGGVFYTIDSLNAGILYSTTRFVNEDNGFYTQTVYVQLGYQI